ncbi:MAG: hypothetical protein E6H09_11685 [Bacteroidetes bacterium]|nr:MAG: hypothetical protein E6H09_11685 [Bacteroidota bacterium]
MDTRIAKQSEIEIQLRGSTLIVAIKLEVFLMNIIYFSNAQQYNNPESKSLKIKHLTFGGKIERAKDLLSKHHPDLLLSSSLLFDKLDGFLKFRNQIAHCVIFWPNEKVYNLQIWDVVESPNKLQFYAPIDFTTKEIKIKIVDYLNQITPPLIALQNEVQQRLQRSDPEVFAVLSSATSTDDK